MRQQLEQQIIQALGRIVALYLWDLDAIKVSLDKPFRLASGNYSPIYINCRQLISSVSFMDLFAAASRQVLDERSGVFNFIAGGETAGIPFAAFLACAFGKPMIYVRKAAKEHGITSRIEGNLGSASQVLLVEDLITDAGSKLTFIQAIRDAGGRVEDVLVIFDRLQGGKDILMKEGIRLHALTDIDAALVLAKTDGLLPSKSIESVRRYLDSPRQWHLEKGLQYDER